MIKQKLYFFNEINPLDLKKKCDRQAPNFMFIKGAKNITTALNIVLYNSYSN